MQPSSCFMIARRAVATVFVTTALSGPAAGAACAQATVQAGPVALSADAEATALLPGDVLRIRIWREPDLSGDFTVTEPGIVILPRLGPLKVTGVPAARLEAQVIAGYRQYLNTPSIEVIPLRRVAIVGAVRSPGMYPVDPSVTLGQVVNVAGGIAPEAQRGKLELRRHGQRFQVDLDADSGLAATRLMSGDEVYVPERSWLARNATWFVSTLVGLGTSVAFIATQ